MEITDTKSDLITIDEIAKFLGISKKFIVKHRQNGRLPGVKRIGDRSYRYDKDFIVQRLQNGVLLYPKK